MSTFYNKCMHSAGPYSIQFENISTSDSDISLTWTTPFVLNVEGFNPQLTYCVDIVNYTSSSVTLHSECGISETAFTYPIPHVYCHGYNFTVRPVAVVGYGDTITLSYLGVEEGIIMRVIPSHYNIIGVHYK